jgi:anti-sigma factor RsiW
MSDAYHNNVVMLPRRRARSPVAALLRLPSRAAQRRSAGTSPPPGTISDYELHAFVDDALDSARRERVKLFLLRHPAAAAEAAAYRQQNRLLRELRRAPSSASPAVGYLSAQFARRVALARRRRALVLGAVAAVLAATAVSLLGGGAWLGVPHVVLTAGR